MTNRNDRIFVITKNSADYGIVRLDNGMAAVKMPVYAFLYLLSIE